MNEHDLVVLCRDLPEHGLEVGDVGVIVALHGREAIEAEFVNAAGETLAVVTLDTTAIRPMEGSEILHVRAVSLA